MFGFGSPQQKFLRAANKGNLDLVRDMLAKDAGLIQAADEDGWTALHYAARQGHKEIVDFLISSGASLNVLTGGDEEHSPLQLAVIHNHPGIVAALIAAKAEVNIRGSGNITPLSSAARYGNSYIVDMLLAAGADPDIENNQGRKPADRALQYKHPHIVRKLNEASAARKDSKALVASRNPDAFSKVSDLFTVAAQGIIIKNIETSPGVILSTVFDFNTHTIQKTMIIKDSKGVVQQASIAGATEPFSDSRQREIQEAAQAMAIKARRHRSALS